jgi:hypothetical protein
MAAKAASGFQVTTKADGSIQREVHSRRSPRAGKPQVDHPVARENSHTPGKKANAA